MIASVVIINWNGAAFLRLCLDALLEQMAAEDEIILVDNASADESLEVVRPYLPRVKLVTHQRNLGYAGGANAGIEVAQGEALILMNPDVRVHHGWLAALKQALGAAETGIAGCKLYYPDSKMIQHAGGMIEFPMGIANHYGYRQQDKRQWDRVRQVDYVTGAAWAVQRQLVDEIGLLDEGFYPAYYEEVDYCFRARAAGYRVHYEPGAAATHYEYAGLGEASYRYLRYFHRHRLQFVLKHRGPRYFVDRLVPAERAWLAKNLASYPRHAFSGAYFDVMLAYPRLYWDQSVVTGHRSEDSFRSVLQALAELRDHVRRSPGIEK